MANYTALTPDNIETAIEALRKQVAQPYAPRILLVPAQRRVINRFKYKGIGRPKTTDYDWLDIIWADATQDKLV